MTQPTVSEFAAEARAWLDGNAKRRHDSSADTADAWGVGDFSVAVFHALSFEQERGLLNEMTGWHHRFARVRRTWPDEGVREDLLQVGVRVRDAHAP